MTRSARDEFNSLVIPPITPIANHSHGFAAATRAVARSAISNYGAMLGFRPYSYQMSTSEEQLDVSGSREYYWTRDTVVTPNFTPPSPNSLVHLIDVDYYVDMPRWLLQRDNVTALYTIVPEAVAYTDNEHSMTFDRDSNIIVKAAGGAEYRHQLWNYGTDILDVYVENWYDFFTTGITAMTYQVETRRIAPQRCIIVLIPLVYWRSITGMLIRFLTVHPLRRLKVAEGEYLRLDIISNRGATAHLRSTGFTESYHCATIPVSSDTTLASMARQSAVKLSSAQVQSLLYDPSVVLDVEKRASVAALLEYHNSKLFATPDAVYPVVNSVRTYQFNTGNYDETCKASVTPFMHPFILGCYAPTRGLANEEQAVKGRVTNVKTTVSLTPFLNKCMNEFLSLMIPFPESLHPVDTEEVYKRQDRPMQRALLNSASPISWMKRTFKVFLKAETYDEPKDPRLITTINSLDKLNYSRYLYAMSDIFVTYDWYAFGKSPKNIAARVSAICESAVDFIDTSDASRWDGHVTEVARVFERLMLLRFFHSAYHPEIIVLHSAQFNQAAVTTSGVKYDSEFIRGSGSPETALFNSAEMCFLGYYAHRLAGDGPNVAWNKLGIYGGDDAINVDVEPKYVDSAFKALGQVVKSNVIQKGKIGVNFLARYYGPGVWAGDPSSCCDIKRQLLKFHTTVNITGYTPQAKMIEKCLAFYLTDANTPIIGAYCAKVLELADIDLRTLDPKKLNKTIVPYFARYPRDEQFPNIDQGNWMIDYLHSSCPEIDLNVATTWIAALTDLAAALAPPLLTHADPPDPVVDEDVVVDGTIIHAQKKAKPKPKPPPRQKKVTPLLGKLNTFNKDGTVKHAATGPPPDSDRSLFQVDLSTDQSKRKTRPNNHLRRRKRAPKPLNVKK